MEDVIFEAENLVDIVPILELLVGEELQHPRHPPYVLQQPRLLLQHNCHPGGGEKIFQLRTERKEGKTSVSEKRQQKIIFKKISKKGFLS